MRVARGVGSVRRQQPAPHPRGPRRVPVGVAVPVGHRPAAGVAVDHHVADAGEVVEPAAVGGAEVGAAVGRADLPDPAVPRRQLGHGRFD